MSDVTHMGMGLIAGLVVGGVLGWYFIAQPAFGAIAGGLAGLAIGYLLDHYKN